MNQATTREEFTFLYHECFDYVYSYIFARTLGNSQLTEDIVQDTFAAAWLHFHRFDHKSSCKTWFCSIAKNKLREYYRGAIRRERYELSDDATLTGQADGFDLEEAALNLETRQCVMKALGTMPAIYRYALMLKYMDSMSVKEIAQSLGRSPKAVDGVLQRAKASFAKTFVKMGGRINNHE